MLIIIIYYCVSLSDKILSEKETRIANEQCKNDKKETKKGDRKISLFSSFKFEWLKRNR